MSTAFGWLTHAPPNPTCTERYDGHCYISPGRRPGPPKWVPGWCWGGGGGCGRRRRLEGLQGFLAGRWLKVPQIQLIDVQTVLKTVQIRVLFLNEFTPRMPSMVSAQRRSLATTGSALSSMRTGKNRSWMPSRMAACSGPWRFHRGSTWTRFFCSSSTRSSTSLSLLRADPGVSEDH